MTETFAPPAAPDPWPACGWHALRPNAQGWLEPTRAWWVRWLERPELQPPADACAAERGLHHRLGLDPLRPVAAHELHAIADVDARDNWRHWLSFRDALEAVGTLEGWYLQLMRSGHIPVPPLFIDLVVQNIVRGLLDGGHDAFVWRAAELLFRVQRVSVQEGAVLAGDRETLDMLNETGGFGELGRLLAQAQAPLRRVQIRVLTPESAAAQMASACADPPRFDTLLDLGHEIAQDLGHGVQLRLARAQSGLKGLSHVLERWVGHLLAVRVHIKPVSRIQDERWRWHIGLDAVASALLNDLYEGREVGDDRQRALISLFRLHFDNPMEMRGDLRHSASADAGARGMPVYLGLAMNAEGLLRLKPQNLLLNLPLARD